MKIILLIVCFAIGETTSARQERSSGGTPTSIEQASFFVSIRKNNVYKCGGVLITDRHVLTVAICVVDMGKKLDYTNEVVTGTDNTYKGGTKYPIALIMPVKGFTDPRYDLAVLVLPPDDVRSFLLKTLPIGRPSFGASANLYAFEGAENPKNTLLHKLPLVPHPDDQDSESHDVAEQIRPKMFLGYPEHGRVFNEDVGGPLVQNGKLIGIASTLGTRVNSTPVFFWVHNFRRSLKSLVPTAKIFK